MFFNYFSIKDLTVAELKANIVTIKKHLYGVIEGLRIFTRMQILRPTLKIKK